MIQPLCKPRRPGEMEKPAFSWLRFQATEKFSRKKTEVAPRLGMTITAMVGEVSGEIRTNSWPPRVQRWLVPRYIVAFQRCCLVAYWGVAAVGLLS